MATTVGGGMVHRQGPGNNSMVTDSYDFNRNRDYDNPAFSMKKLLARRNPYQALRYAATYLGSEEGKSIPTAINLGNLKRPRKGEFKNGGLLPRKLTMLSPDGKAQMELSGGNRIFSRANTRELVSRSLSTKTPTELKALDGRIRQMLDQQDRNKPEYVTE